MHVVALVYLLTINYSCPGDSGLGSALHAGEQGDNHIPSATNTRRFQVHPELSSWLSFSRDRAGPVVVWVFTHQYLQILKFLLVVRRSALSKGSDEVW